MQFFSVSLKMEDPIQTLIFPFFLQRLYLCSKLWFFFFLSVIGYWTNSYSYSCMGYMMFLQSAQIWGSG